MFLYLSVVVWFRPYYYLGKLFTTNNHLTLFNRKFYQRVILVEIMNEKELYQKHGKMEYQKRLELHPDYVKEKYQRQLELHPNYCKEKYLRTLKLHPNIIREKYERRLELHPDFNKGTIKFKHKQIWLGFNPLTGKCSKCKRTVKSGKIKLTYLHHDIYDWNDILANTRELCNSCHMSYHRKLHAKPIPEINKPQTTYEMKLWSKISDWN